MKTLRGFTLVELIATMAVAVIMVTVAVPSFSTMIRNNRLATQANQFVASLTLARSEAVKRETQVTLCRSTDGATCNGSNWEDGWIVFSDLDRDSTPDVGTGTCANGEDCILRAEAVLVGPNTLRTDANFATAVAYLPSGMSRGNGGSATGTFRLCDARGQTYARAIVIGPTGRAKIGEGTASCP
jgi:type IV fimbrial biogenesis protein FimT